MTTRSVCLFTFCLYVLMPIEIFSETLFTSHAVFSEKEMSCEVLPIFRGLWDGSILEDPGRLERAAWIVRLPDGKLASVRWPYLGERYKITWKYQLPHQTLAQVHTHPRAASPQPSNEDRRQATRLKLPFYVISRRGVWIAMADGSIHQEFGVGWAEETQQNPIDIAQCE